MGTAVNLKESPGNIRRNRELLHVQEGNPRKDGQFHVNVVDAWGAAV